MKHVLMFASLSFASAGFATEILSAHAGHFRCRCLHEGCKETKTSDVTLLVDQTNDRLAIDYGDETQSGAPTRTAYRDGSVLYTLASKGTVGFTASGEMRFGWGKLWTCQKLP